MKIKAVKIHNLDDETVRIARSINDCADALERSAYQSCVELQNVITMGKTIAEPVYGDVP